MHFMIAFFVIVGLIGAVMFLNDEHLNLFGMGEAASIVKKFKQEEEAFAQFCKEQEKRDIALKADPVQTAKVENQNNTPVQPVRQAAAPVRSPAASGGPAFNANPFGSTASAVTSNPKPFGNVDFSSFGDAPAPAPAAQAPAAQASAPASGGSPSQAQQLQNSSNPIIKTWAGYVSQIEAAEK